MTWGGKKKVETDGGKGGAFYRKTFGRKERALTTRQGNAALGAIRERTITRRGRKHGLESLLWNERDPEHVPRTSVGQVVPNFIMQETKKRPKGFGDYQQELGKEYAGREKEFKRGEIYRGAWGAKNGA